MKNRKYRVLISGGGTGGHIFPALSIANALKRRQDMEILFVGADNRMEMEKVPAAGYRIIGLPVAGFDRKRLWRNFGVLLKLWRSIRKARKIVADFKPDIAVGVGGYCSGPTLKAAQRAGVPTLLQEQNSYAGVTNKLLAQKARDICVAYPRMERFFPADKIVVTGNPVRKDLCDTALTPKEARGRFGLHPDKATVLIVGGSLGALTLNESMERSVKELADSGIQVIWQTGKSFAGRATADAKGLKGVVVTPFISDMAAAYMAATLVVSRAGAGAISEIELLGKPAILVPSPNVAEDHQTKNAMALVNKNAAFMITDSEAREKLGPAIMRLLGDSELLKETGRNARAMAHLNSDEKIADRVMAILEGGAR